MKTGKLICLLIILSIFSCKQEKDSTITRDNFKNTLDIKYIPQSEYKIDNFGFADLGAWQGYTLPENDSTEFYGGFCGPLSMRRHGTWISKSLSQLRLFNLTTEKYISFADAKFESNYLPGYLVQNITLKNLKIEMKLFFISSRTAIQETKIINTSKNNIKLKIQWMGKLLANKTEIIKKENGIKVNYTDDQKDYILVSHKQVKEIFVAENKKSYILTEQITNLKSNKSIVSELTQSHYFNNNEKKIDKKNIISAFNNSEKLFKKNSERWNTYLNKYFSKLTNEYNDLAHQKLAVKCIQTLLTNWRSKAGDLHHDGVFPSASYQGFYGFWSWDTWKHSVALVNFAPELAKSGMFSMFDYQDEHGMVADCIYFTKRSNNWRDTKAPLSAWAVYKIYEETKDLKFVKEIFPKLIKYHNWWYTNRDFDKNGLCEYGSTDGSLVAAKWESGMDNAVRFDSTTIKKLNDNAWTFNQESVDLNAYLYKEKLFLSKLSKLVGYTNKFEEEAAILKNKINKLMFDKSTGFYYDIKSDNKEKIKIKGPEGWIPLWANIASKEQAKGVQSTIIDKECFNTLVPFPTLTANHPKFNPLEGYWRGPVWLDQFYFGVVALKNYGYKKEAKMMTDKLFNNGAGILGSEAIRENYHPITGEGLNASNFSWSAAHILLLMK